MKALRRVTQLTADDDAEVISRLREPDLRTASTSIVDDVDLPDRIVSWSGEL